MDLLIVDDEKLIALGIQHVIEKMQTQFTQVDVAFSAKEALNMLKSQKYDLLLTDISMPEISGLQLIQEAKRLNLCENFCILTGYSEFEYAQTAIHLGVSQYLLKPVDKEKLQEFLNTTADKIVKDKRQERINKENFFQDILLNDNNGSFSFPFQKDMLLTVAIGPNTHNAEFSRKSFQPLLDQNLVDYLLHIHHYPAFIFISNNAFHKNELLNALTVIAPNLTLSYAAGPVLHGSDLQRLYFSACQAALCARYLLDLPIIDSEKLSPFLSLNSDQLKRELCQHFKINISEKQLTLYRIELMRLLGISESKSDANSQKSYVHQMIQIIEKRFREDLSLNDIASSIGLNADYASRLLKSQTGLSFPQFLNQFRIMQTINCILENPSLSFEQVAPTMGFSDMRNFYRVFRKVMNTTPGKYRKQILQSNHHETDAN